MLVARSCSDDHAEVALPKRYRKGSTARQGQDNTMPPYAPQYLPSLQATEH